MKVLATAGRDDVARVFIADFGRGRLAEFVESVQPPLPRDEKWVLIVSPLFGCPVRCLMCDAGTYYRGRLSEEEIFEQIDYLVGLRYAGRRVPVKKFKIQFARSGDPALNPAVLEVLDELPARYEAPGLVPSLSTIAPASTDRFFERLLEIKNRRYSGGRFTLQFSIHTTDAARRDAIIPVKKWSFGRIAEYGRRFFAPGDRKIALNFALAKDSPVDPHGLARDFDPAVFLVKMTPLNPTYRAMQNGLASYLDGGSNESGGRVAAGLRAEGYEVIVSIGEREENLIGSNCGQAVVEHMKAVRPMAGGYTYTLR